MACRRSSLGLMAWLLAALMLVACGSDSEEVGTPLVPASASGVPATAAPASPGSSDVTPTEAAVAGPQSDRLLLIEENLLVIQEADGTRRELVRVDLERGFPTYPAWSPDGQTIAFVQRLGYSGDAEADWGDDLLLVPVGGGEPRVVRAHAAKGELIVGVTWTPDSEGLLVGRLQIGFNNGVPSRTDSTAIVEIDVSSGAERVVLTGGYDPSLSADGARMAYLRYEEAGIPTVMMANADGSEARALAGADSFSQVRLPRISPDGRLVAFAAATPVESSMRAGDRGWFGALLAGLAPLAPRKAEAHGAPMDIWVAEVETGEVRQLTFLGADDPYLGWSPDGERVVFIETNGLYEVSVGEASVVRVGEGRFGGKLAVAPE